MSQQPGTGDNPAGYGAVTDPYQPAYNPHDPSTAPSPPYPQPGEPAPPGSYPDFPQEPPPKYEPPKGSQGYPAQPAPQGYPPVGGTYPPQGYQQAGGVYPVTQQTIVVQNVGWGQSPRLCECPNCRAQVTTSITYQPGGLTWLSGGLICLFGCWAGCCLIPLCIPELQDVVHTCPNCQAHLGTYRRI